MRQGRVLDEVPGLNRLLQGCANRLFLRRLALRAYLDQSWAHLKDKTGSEYTQADLNRTCAAIFGPWVRVFDYGSKCPLVNKNSALCITFNVAQSAGFSLSAHKRTHRSISGQTGSSLLGTTQYGFLKYFWNAVFQPEL